MQPLKFQVDPFRAVGDWTIDSPFRDKVNIEGIEIFLSGLQAKHPQFGEIVGSAANLGAFPENRAWYELMERISILESSRRETFTLRAPSNGYEVGEVERSLLFPTANSPEFQFARSNGVALHTTWEEACRRACFEMVERHRVLASWAGLTKPVLSRNNVQGSPLNRLWNVYDVVRIDFGSQTVSCFDGAIHVSGVALLPKLDSSPLIIAFGAAFSAQESMAKAENETLQRLGFLWGEEIPTTEPEFNPSNLYHQEYYLFSGARKKLEDWLDGKYFANGSQALPKLLNVQFVDLSMKSLDLHVAKAISPEAIPLVFGRWREREFRDLPADRLIHPIA